MHNGKKKDGHQKRNNDIGQPQHQWQFSGKKRSHHGKDNFSGHEQEHHEDHQEYSQAIQQFLLKIRQGPIALINLIEGTANRRRQWRYPPEQQQDAGPPPRSLGGQSLHLMDDHLAEHRHHGLDDTLNPLHGRPRRNHVATGNEQ